jgi:hypothetical protein
MMFKSLHFRLQNEHAIGTSVGPEQLLPFNLVMRATRKHSCRRADHGTAHEFHRNPLHQAGFGRHLFSLIDTKLKTFKPEILEDLQTENKLVREYMEQLSRVRIPFEGEERNLSQMSPYTQSKNRDVRIRAQKAVTSFFLENEAAFDRIFDEMVKPRTPSRKDPSQESWRQLQLGWMLPTIQACDHAVRLHGSSAIFIT